MVTESVTSTTPPETRAGRPFLEVKDLQVHFPTDDGLVKAVNGLSFTLERGKTLGEDYVRTARAKGLRERNVIGKHALRSGLTPIVTIFGLDLGALMGGAVLTETVFNLRGLGYQALTAIRGNDLPVILGVVLIAAFFIIAANLIVDLVYGVIDPRVRLG